MTRHVLFHFVLLLQKFNKDSILQEFTLNPDEKVIAVYKRPYPFFWHEKYGDERRNREPESLEGIQIATRPQKLSSQCELGSHTVLDGCMVLTNQALYKCRPRYVTRVPVRTEKPGKWEGIFQSVKSQGILNRLEKAGKSHKILENSGNFRKVLFVML